MRRACERGCRLFDFGRSKLGTGAFAFKNNWGFEPTPLVYQFGWPPGRKSRTSTRSTRNTPLFIAAWKRLPLAVATRLGPPIVRGLG